MQYLAEVHRKSGFIGHRTEVKLLARQQSEQNWAMVSGEELLPAEAASDFGDGVLVLVEVDSNQNVKNVQDATRHLIGILKNFSRMKEKFRSQEEEIEGWKQSLIYQSQELTRREVDMEARAEELQQLESEAQKIEQQRQEFEESRNQILQLKEQVERDRQQLEEAWGRLHTAQREFEENNASQSTGLSDEQVHQMELLLHQLESLALVTDTTRNRIDQALSGVEAQQGFVSSVYQTLEQERQQAQHRQDEINHQWHQLHSAQQLWQEQQRTIETNTLDLRVQEQVLGFKVNQLQERQGQLEAYAQSLRQLHEIQQGMTGGAQVNLRALWEISLSDLEAETTKLQQEMTKLSSFVNDQEEELTLQQQAIDELQVKINQASEYDRMTLAGDLEDEKQRYQLLDQTLKGQRETLQEKEAVVKVHQEVLTQRHGSQNAMPAKDHLMELGAAIQSLEQKQSEGEQGIRRLQADIEHLQAVIQQMRPGLESMVSAQEQRRGQLEQQAQSLKDEQASLSEQWGRVNTYQQLLEPTQNHLNGLRSQLMQLASEDWQQLQETEAQHRQSTAELKQLLVTLGKAPEFAPSSS
ncbi:hypothetical protein GS597_17375 [Synechococcales cyanobacterium C]|uniref:Uncharacterized protein n=1 Tax=Petrachloros mirabilis ULC683 TaxID=2781853 RepID=A0A8K2A1Z8_9CYAN|nr:hypothetical protein [Petrachloros mirabilis ULC683]